MSAVFGREPSRPLPDQDDEPVEAVVVDERGPDDETMTDLRDDADLDERLDADLDLDEEPVSIADPDPERELSTAGPDREPELSTADPDPGSAADLDREPEQATSLDAEPRPAADLDPEPEPHPALDLDPRDLEPEPQPALDVDSGDLEPEPQPALDVDSGDLEPEPPAAGLIAEPAADVDAGAYREADGSPVGGPVALTDESAGRWDELQVRFVDDPRGAVDGAAALLAEALAATTPGEASTEDLRVAFQRYRAAFRDLRPA
jgi:hypothetical protein